jgi:hypothetical protein
MPRLPHWAPAPGARSRGRQPPGPPVTLRPLSHDVNPRDGRAQDIRSQEKSPGGCSQTNCSAFERTVHRRAAPKYVRNRVHNSSPTRGLGLQLVWGCGWRKAAEDAPAEGAAKRPRQPPAAREGRGGGVGGARGGPFFWASQPPRKVVGEGPLPGGLGG